MDLDPFLTHLDYAGDIWLLSRRVVDLIQMVLNLEEAGNVRMETNTKKTKGSKSDSSYLY